MPSHLRGTLVMVTLGALLACSRTSSNDAGKWSFPKPKSDPTAWQVKCDALCDVKAKAATLDALCAATVDAVKSTFGPARCESRASIGFPAIPASAVTDAAIVELVPQGKTDRHAFLALKSVKGWQLARPLGAAPKLEALSAQPIDVPGIEPAGVQLQVALVDGSSRSERMFVCGVDGDGSTKCTVAIEVASNKPSSFLQMGAGVADAMRPQGWRAAVEITPQGFVAKRTQGTLPEGLAGEHGWSAEK